MTDERIARFEKRREELKKLSDDQLKARFWELCNQTVEPILGFARTHTSPSIERAVLLRMGIDSVSSHGISMSSGRLKSGVSLPSAKAAAPPKSLG